METNNPNSFVLKKFEQLGYEYHDLVPPSGHGAGGLALFWKQEVNLEVLDANPNLFDTCIELEGKTFFASFVYGDNDATTPLESLDQSRGSTRLPMVYYWRF